MKNNRDRVIAWIGLSEGGYVNNPRDNGGATNRGITQRTYDAWRAKTGQVRRDVRQITKSEADTIVFDEYMRPIRFDELYDGLDYAVADMAVNSGVSRAAKTLQQALGFRGRDVDGVLGVKTLAALPTVMASRMALLDRYADGRLAFAKSLKGPNGWPAWGKGWTRRYEGVHSGTQTTDIGVRDRAAMLLAASKSTAPVAPTIPAPLPVGPVKAPPQQPFSIWQWFMDLF